MKTLSTLLAVCLLAVAAHPVLGQSALPPRADVGQPVRVFILGGSVVSGMLAEPVTDAGIVVQSSNTRTGLPWSRIALVEVLQPRSPRRGSGARALQGALAGAAAGALAGFVASVAWQGPRGEERSRKGMVGGGAAIGGGVGLLVGSLIGYQNPGQVWKAMPRPVQPRLTPQPNGSVGLGLSIAW